MCVLGFLSVVFAVIHLGSFAGHKVELAELAKEASAIFASGMAENLSVLGIPEAFGGAFGVTILVIMAITVMQLVLRIMRVASAELLDNAFRTF